MKKILNIFAGIAGLSTAVTPVIALTSCKDKDVQFNVSIINGTYDKSKSSLKLNKDSKLVLNPLFGREIYYISNVKVGASSITSDGYDFDYNTNTLTIYGAYMTSNIITVSIEDQEVSSKIWWTEGWYASECAAEGEAPTEKTDVKFTLENSLESGQELSYQLERVDEYSDARVDLVGGDLACDGTTVTIPFNLKSHESSFIYFGNHVTYNISFICRDQNTNETVWEKTLNNCFFYALVNLNKIDTKEKTTKNSAVFKLNHSISVSNTYTGFTFTTSISNIKRSANVPADVTVQTVGSLNWKLLKTFEQTIKWNKTDGLTDGDCITFDMEIELVCDAAPYMPIVFHFDGLKLIYGE